MRISETSSRRFSDLEDRELAKLERYEYRCFRRLTWATNQIRSKKRPVILPRTARHIHRRQRLSKKHMFRRQW